MCVCKHLELELQGAVNFLFKGIVCSELLGQFSSPQKGYILSTKFTFTNSKVNSGIFSSCPQHQK